MEHNKVSPHNENAIASFLKRSRLSTYLSVFRVCSQEKKFGEMKDIMTMHESNTKLQLFFNSLESYLSIYSLLELD